MNSLDFFRGQTVVASLGPDTKGWLFYRITHRDETWIRLKPLKSVEVDGKWVPGDIDSTKKGIRRLVLGTPSHERIGGIAVDGFSFGLRVYRRPKGGKRVGAGRKPGRGKGRTAVTRSISMQREEWERFDEQRNKVSRGNFLSKLLDRKE
jgi:hypothetical protein